MKQHRLAVCIGLSGQQECSRLERGFKDFSSELTQKIVETFFITIAEFEKELNSGTDINLDSTNEEESSKNEKKNLQEISNLVTQIHTVHEEYLKLQTAMKISDLETEIKMLKEVFRLK
ncbi:MAG: hypothetical protein PSX36_13485 [bacterium]|nr:hypothetical protein [bacterium]